MTIKNIPRIGIGVIVVKDNKILLGKRKNSHGEGSWSFPGGHLEFGETPEECAIREVVEETGLKIKNLKRGPFTNDFFEKENKHYITLFIVAEYEAGEPKILEPDKCESWHWIATDKFPKPLFKPIENLISQINNLEKLLQN